MIKHFLKIFFVIFILISIYNIIVRLKWDKKTDFFFIIDTDHFLKNEIEFERILYNLSNSGIQSIAFDFSYIDKLGFEKIFVKDKFKFVINLDNNKYYDFEKLKNFCQRFKNNILTVSILEKTPCLESSEGIKISSKKLLQIIETNGFLKLNFEFQKNIHSRKVISLRCFICDVDKISSHAFFDIENIFLKIKKALYERSCKAIYIKPSCFLTYEENLVLIRKLVDKFKPKPFIEIKNLKTISFAKFSNFIAIIFSIFCPLYLFKNIIKKIDFFQENLLYFTTNFLCILLGIFLWGWLQKYEYISLEEDILGIKIMLFFPLLCSFFVVLNKQEIKKFLLYKIRLRDFLFLGFSFLVFIYLFLRSGNINEGFVLKFEMYFRNFIENLFLFRPRLKEVFFGQPLFFICLKFLKKNKTIFLKILFCLSIISQTSIINTFLHIHTPLHICVLRSVVGVFLGYFLGFFILFLIYEKSFNKWLFWLWKFWR